MVKLIGKDKIRCAVFISGRGSNLKSIYKYANKKSSKFEINLVISNKSNTRGVKFATKNKIASRIIKFNNKQQSEKIALWHLKKKKIEYIFLAGFMKILSKAFIEKYKNKIINIHPSLLPKFKGLDTHKRAIENGEKFSGCTVHFVTSKLDSGKIIMQRKIKIYNSDTPKKLEKRVLKAENKLYPMAIRKILSNY